MTTITITSYGTGHHDAPQADDPVVVDTTALRNPPSDPDVRSRMTQLTGLDRDVAHYVMTTPGAERVAETALLAVFDRLAKAPDEDVEVHVSCTGGRHRSVAITENLVTRLRALDAVRAEVHAVHRHIDRPILPPSPRTDVEKPEAVETETVETIRYTADVVAMTPDGHVLLIERDWPPFEGAWALPGGHVDVGETSRVAAARELAEETGVHVDAENLVQIGSFDEPGRDPRGRYVTVAYLAEVPEGTPIVAGDDARTARWWPVNSLPSLAFDHDEILAAGRRARAWGDNF